MTLAIPTVDEIRAKTCSVVFGEPIIENSYRGIVAEVIIGAALGADWKWCSGDWRGWDFEHSTGCRLEVKQSAARQTWPAPKKARPPVFDIRERTGYYEGADWTAKTGRHSHVYVFAYHPVIDDTADQRAPEQWRFHVVAATHLPAQKTISLAQVGLLSDGTRWGELSAAIEAVRAAVVQP